MKVATASDENYKLYGPGKNSGTEGSRELRNSGLVEFSDTRIVCMVCIAYVFYLNCYYLLFSVNVNKRVCVYFSMQKEQKGCNVYDCLDNSTSFVGECYISLSLGLWKLHPKAKITCSIWVFPH